MNKDNLDIPIQPEVSSSTDTSNFDTSDIEAEGHVANSSWDRLDSKNAITSSVFR